MGCVHKLTHCKRGGEGVSPGGCDMSGVIVWGGGCEASPLGGIKETHMDMPAKVALKSRRNRLKSYAVLPGVDIRCHAFSHQYRVIKLNSPQNKPSRHCLGALGPPTNWRQPTLRGRAVWTL